MAIYTVAMGKGGTTKTTTAAELVAHLARCGRSVRALDSDRQGNLSTRLGITADTEGIEVVAADVLAGRAAAAESVSSPSVPGAVVLAGTHDLDDLDAPVSMLVERMTAAAADVDDLVIDTRPSLHRLTEAALRAADVIVAPCTCEGESFDQVEELAAFLQLRIGGRVIDAIVPARYDGRRVLDREVVALLTEQWPQAVTPPVRETVTVKDAYVAACPVSVHAPRSAVAADYAAVCAAITGTAGPAPEATDTTIHTNAEAAAAAVERTDR